MALEFSTIYTLDLDPETRSQLYKERPDIGGYDRKVTNAVVVAEFLQAVDRFDEVSDEAYEKARTAAKFMLETHTSELTGLFGENASDHLRLIVSL